MDSPSYEPDDEGMNYQEQQAWTRAVEKLSELDGTLSMRFKTAGSSREFEIIYIPLPSKDVAE